MDYYVGLIFGLDDDYPNKVKFCNENNLYIKELESNDGSRRFEICEMHYSDETKMRWRIDELKSNLRETDYQAIKFAEGLITESEYAEIKAKRQAWRDEINELEEKIK